MSLLYGPNFKYPDGEMRKNQLDIMDSYNHHQQQTHQQNSGLMRYCSAPSSFLESLAVNGSDNNFGGANNGGLNSEDYRYIRSSSPEMENLFAKYMISSNGSGDSGNSVDIGEFRRKAMKQEEAESISEQNGSYARSGSQMICQSLPAHNLANENTTTMDSSFCAMNSMGLQNSMQAKLGTANGSNLVRQSSSPAGFLSNLGVENGFTVMKDLGNFRACNGTNGEASPLTSRLSGHINFSSGLSSCSRLMPQIADIETESMGASSPENRSLGNVNGSDRHYMPNFASDSWKETSFSGLKRARENDGNMFSRLNTLKNQNGDSRNQPTGLTHHLSLPKTSFEMAAIEKFLQFQGTVPCKIRAKRGFATHPRSIAERVRRTRISERMRKLQELFPNMDKQTNTADMLDLAVEHIKDLQKQVKTLTDKRAKCTCKEKRCPNPSA